MNAHSSQQQMVLENAQVIMPDRVIERGSVVIDSGLITGIAWRAASGESPLAERAGSGGRLPFARWHTDIAVIVGRAVGLAPPQAALEVARVGVRGPCGFGTTDRGQRRKPRPPRTTLGRF
jgi:hypothetical protein